MLNQLTEVSRVDPDGAICRSGHCGITDAPKQHIMGED